MMTPPIKAPPRAQLIDYVLRCGSRYWPGDHLDLLRDAASTERMSSKNPAGEMALGCGWFEVPLPDSLRDLGDEGGRMLVDAASVDAGDGPDWKRCDWWLAAFSYLSGAHEWRHELAHGPIHSYRYRLKGVPDAVFERAWANRILLLIRRLCAIERGVDEVALFGKVPAARIVLTYDVDAIEKTLPIRIKQGAFEGVNALRRVLRRDVAGAGRQLARAARFLLSRADYFRVEEVAELAQAHGLKGRFHVYAQDRRRSPRAWFFDPGYRFPNERLRAALVALAESGWEIGLHGSFGSWNNGGQLAQERAVLERELGSPVRSCRQHWLMFSWQSTWSVHAEAGFVEDSTLGFNDQSGYRIGTALRFHPWDFARGAEHRVAVLPKVLMDSQLFSYSTLGAVARAERIGQILSEAERVGGEAAVLWHPHTLAPDYGWRPGFEQVLSALSRAGSPSADAQSHARQAVN